MSFILDALKKSETERQRQSGPALFEVKVAPPRHRFAIWAVALAALLAINLVVVGWMLSRSSSGRSAARVAAAQAPGTAEGSRSAAGSGAAPASAPVAAATLQRLPGAPPGASSPAAPPTGANPNAGTAAAASSSPAGSVQPAAPESVARLNPSPPATAGAAATNPEDLAPAVEPTRGSAAPDSGGSVVREPERALPSYQQAAAAPGANIPPLKLDFHVYSPKPDQRFVFLNMVKLHEGEALPQGVRVDAITPDGVILSYQGTRFVLQHQ